MSIQWQNIDIAFAKGLDTKTDPKRVPVGNFLKLENTVFGVTGQLTKRNGFGRLPALPDGSSTFLTTFNGNLLAVGSSLRALAEGANAWVNRGTIYPAELSALPLLRSNTYQSQADSVVASNGLVCTVFTDNVPSGTATVPSYKYVIADSITGQNVVSPRVIPVSTGTISGAPRVFLLGRYFIIVITNLISSTYHLQYVAISSNNPTMVNTEVDVSTQYDPSTPLNFDGYVANNSLYLAWNGPDSGGALRVTFLTSTLSLGNTVIFTGLGATIISVTADITQSTPVIYVAAYNSSSTFTQVLALNAQMTIVLNHTQILAGGTILTNLSSTAQNGVCTVYYERATTYGYDSSIPSHHIAKISIAQDGTVGTSTFVKRSVGLASKAFLLDGVAYMLSAYQSPFQPTYFLIDLNGNVVAKLAYSNGGGYCPTGTPNVTLNGNIAQIAYLYKASVEAVNKAQGVANVGGVYAQLGVNLATFTLGTSNVIGSEIGSNLNLTGGIVYAYDGYSTVEQGFHLWPDSVEVATSTGVTRTGNTTSASNILTNISSVAGLSIGMKVTGTNVPAGSVITAIGTTTITLSQQASGTASGTTFTLTGNLIAQQYYYIATYEWSDNQGNLFRSAPSIPVAITTTTAASFNTINVPTLRVTYKTANPVKIVVYRWSVAQQTYYQVTSIQTPTLNSVTTDSVAIVDSLADASIIGNNILYTTGGVIENIGPPSASTMSLFQSRLFLVDSEDKNLLWFSKQVIESTPVEFSDLFTLYVAPTTSAQGSTGDVKALAPLDGNLIIFKRDAIYYINGVGPDNTGANNQFSDPIFITSTVGCSNQKSIVFIPSGIMFESDKGIWLLDRNLSTTYIGAAVQQYNGDTVLSAVNIPGTNQVRFKLTSGIVLMYDYYYGEWGTFTGVPSISSTLYENLDTYIDSYGRVFQETPDIYLDGSNPVLMSFTSGWFNFGGIQGYQRARQFFLLGKYITPHTINLQIAYDYNPSPTQSTTITPDNFAGTYGSASIYGGGTYGGSSNVEQWRVDLDQQKCQAFQLTLTEHYDSTLGVTAGAGLTLSGIDLTVGIKGKAPKLPASRTTG